MSYFTKHWKVVDPTSYKRTSTGIAHNTNNDWYSKLLTQNISRQNMIRRFDDMDLTIDISRALDIIAEDVSSDDYTDDSPILFDYPEGVKKSQVTTLDRTLENWMEETEFDYKFFDVVREYLKYGILIYKKDKKKGLLKLPQQRIVGYVLNKDDKTKVDKYLYDESREFTNDSGDNVAKESDDVTQLKVEDLLVLKVGDAPMGTSVIESVYRIWKQLTLLEDAVVIYRIVRAPERRVFYIDTGNVAGTKSHAYLNRMKNEMRQKQLIKNNDTLETEYNPASMQEDFFIAQNGEGRGSRVETLAGGENLGRIEDLMYFNKKMSLGLRIPPSYLDSYSDNTDGASMNDGRVGTAYIAEMRYASFIKRLQKRLAKELFSVFKGYADTEGVELPEHVKFTIAPPQNFALYKEIELNSTMLNVYSSTDNMTAISKQYAMKRFMNMQPEDIIENEDTVLLEKGIPKDKIKGLSEEQRMNIVYGDARLIKAVTGEEIQDDGNRF